MDTLHRGQVGSGKERNSGQIPADPLVHGHAGHLQLKRLREGGKLKHHLGQVKSRAGLSVRHNRLDVEAGLALGQRRKRQIGWVAVHTATGFAAARAMFAFSWRAWLQLTPPHQQHSCDCCE